MPTFGRAVMIVLLIAGVAPALASAKPLRRHKAHVAHRTRGPVSTAGQSYWYRESYADRRRNALHYPPGYGPNAADPYAPYAMENPYSPNAAPGAAIRALALRNQYAPGVTNELAPDNIATATGGPSGGIPGFSGH